MGGVVGCQQNVRFGQILKVHKTVGLPHSRRQTIGILPRIHPIHGQIIEPALRISSCLIAELLVPLHGLGPVQLHRPEAFRLLKLLGLTVRLFDQGHSRQTIVVLLRQAVAQV